MNLKIVDRVFEYFCAVGELDAPLGDLLAGSLRIVADEHGLEPDGSLLVEERAEHARGSSFVRARMLVGVAGAGLSTASVDDGALADLNPILGVLDRRLQGVEGRGLLPLHVPAELEELTLVGANRGEIADSRSAPGRREARPQVLGTRSFAGGGNSGRACLSTPDARRAAAGATYAGGRRGEKEIP